MLDTLAVKYGTDKGSNGHWYTRNYEQMLGGIRHQIEAMLEIGLGGGESLRVWLDFFPNAIIHGLDINPVQGSFHGRIQISQFSQVDEKNLLETYSDARLQIIIDDASHEVENTLSSLTYLFPLLQDKGWYVIEDMEPGSFPARIGQWVQEHPDVNELHIFHDRDKGSDIIFIQKK